MRFNVSRIPETFYRLPMMEPMTIFPRFCFDEKAAALPKLPCLSDGMRLDRFMEQKPNATVCLWRTYALGDIIVLTPIINSLKEICPDCKVILATADGFRDVFRYWDLVRTIAADRLRIEQYDIGYYLDGVVERDHAGDHYSYMHRLDIYCDFMGWPVPKDSVFSLPYSDKEKGWAEAVVSEAKNGKRPVVVMQLSGAMWFNSLPTKKVKRIASELAKTYSVILVHNYPSDIKIKGVANLAGRTTVPEAAALIDCADAVVTMDSGALWIAHCTKTPIIAMFGHTRAKEKMAHHRNYHAIDLAGMVGCESCFGRQTKCKGDVRCMNGSDENRILEEIKIGIEKLIS